MQKTIAKPATLKGVGLHTGRRMSMTIKPAAVDSGIIFIRTDITDGRDPVVLARWDHVVDTRLCTVIGNKDDVTIGTIEHLMAALSALGINNAEIHLDGPEVPILDGSAAPHVAAIEMAGILEQRAPLSAIKILKEITIIEGDKTVTLKPSAGRRFDVEIEFNHPRIGFQEAALDMMEPDAFVEHFADARTFGFLHEVSYLRTQGLAQGGSLDNAIVLDINEGSILNPEGLRYTDEFARHKLLDAVGDIYLAGMPIIGSFYGYKPGHALNNQVLRAMYADLDAWCVVDLLTDGHPHRITRDQQPVPSNVRHMAAVNA